MTAKEVHVNQTTGGIPALRGFRKQFLHTLNSILSSETGQFCPESLEDFAARDSAGKLTEIVQVKDYKAKLIFSELKTFLNVLPIISNVTRTFRLFWQATVSWGQNYRSI